MAIPRTAQDFVKQPEPLGNSGSTSVVTRKGQITIPADIRSVLGLELGQRVSIRLEGTTILVERATDSVDRMYGILAQYANPANRTRDIQEIIEEEDEALAQAIVESALDVLESE